MNTKNIFKTLAFAMLMPAVLLTASCSKDDDLVNDPAAGESTDKAADESTDKAADESTEEKGYPVYVTVSATRQGDEATTRAEFGADKKLHFTAGDKLYVVGYYNSYSYLFAGTLDYNDVSGKFSGTIYTQNEWTDTAEKLLTSADIRNATLLPAGYESYGYLSLTGSGYSATLTRDLTNAFATSKAAAVEQFSREWANSYSGGFALSPKNAVLNFTINGLAASTEVAVVLTGNFTTVSKKVTTDASGTATFAIGVEGATDLKDYSLTVGGNAITLVSSSKVLAAGKIYNITREVVTVAEGHALTTAAIGEIVGSDGKAYAVADKDNLPSGVTAVAMVAYKSGSNGLAIALADEASKTNQTTAISTCAGKTDIGGNSWKLPSQDEWKQMFGANGGNNGSYAGLNTAITTAGGTALQNSGYYWSSTPNGEGYAWGLYLGGGDANWISRVVDYEFLARAVLAF